MKRLIPAITAVMLVFVFVIMLFGKEVTEAATVAFTKDDEQTAGKTVYLTFDDGPSDRVTPKILDVLKEEGVHATFFIIGNQALTRDYLIRREVAEGHTVAVHSFTHDYSQIYSSTENLINDIKMCNEVICKITGSYSKVYRFPGGSYGLSQNLISAVTESGLRYIDWNASTCDAEWGMTEPEQLYKNAVATSADCNNIVLLSHDSTTKTATPIAIKSLISYYKSKGYSFGVF